MTGGHAQPSRNGVDGYGSRGGSWYPAHSPSALHSPFSTLLQVPRSDKSLTYKLIKTLLVNEKGVGETC